MRKNIKLRHQQNFRLIYIFNIVVRYLHVYNEDFFYIYVHTCTSAYQNQSKGLPLLNL